MRADVWQPVKFPQFRFAEPSHLGMASLPAVYLIYSECPEKVDSHDPGSPSFARFVMKPKRRGEGNLTYDPSRRSSLRRIGTIYFHSFIIMTWIQKSEDRESRRAPSCAERHGRALGDQAGSSRKSQRGAFSRYLEQLDQAGEPADDTFDELWRALRSAVCHELRRSALWSSPPSYLGFYGAQAWRHGDRSSSSATTSALEELVSECYSHVFLKRLKRLKAQARVRGDIDGLVFLFIRNYIYERRKAHDPLGFHVFDTLRRALRLAVEKGEIFVVSGDPKIRSNTVLAFAGRDGAQEATEARLLESRVLRWNSDLLPDIMTAVGTERQKLVGRLRSHILGLEAWGVQVFRFQDMIEPMKRDIRARWAAFLNHETGETIEKEGERIEAHDSLIKLARRVADRLDRLDVPRKTRRYLQALWRFLGAYACNDHLDEVPSNRKLADRLRIPRERLPGLYQTLREVIRSDATVFAVPLPVGEEMSQNSAAGALSTGGVP